jgi:hypothetical protein
MVWQGLRWKVLLALCVSFISGENPSVESSVSDKWSYKRIQIKAEKLARVQVKSESKLPPNTFKPEGWSASHRSSENAIFAVAMSNTYTSEHAQMFCGTARKVGFTGDIVIGILPGSQASFIETLVLAKATVYTIDLICSAQNVTLCALQGTESYPIGMLRFYLYEWWANMYDTTSWIMISDFRDVFFQADPFKYRMQEWNQSQLVTFQENHPNNVISRCHAEYEFIKGCYGKRAADSISSNTVINSGIAMGTRDALTAYAYIMIQELNPKRRYGRHTLSDSNDGCLADGMEHGLLNWLVYSGHLNKFMEVKIFQQGEGPVNNVGSFLSDRPVMSALLTAENFHLWGLFQGLPPRGYISNWNKDPSPVVHQLDRYLNSSWLPTYGKALSVVQSLQVH